MSSWGSMQRPTSLWVLECVVALVGYETFGLKGVCKKGIIIMRCVPASRKCIQPVGSAYSQSEVHTVGGGGGLSESVWQAIWWCH
jgi:hypothetical protein